MATELTIANGPKQLNNQRMAGARHAWNINTIYNSIQMAPKVP